MSSAWTAGPPPQSFGSRMVDEGRPGSTWGQVAAGGVGIVLAIVLIVGQISLATTKGIQRNLHANVGQIQAGNETMKSVIVKAEPSIIMDTVVAGQASTLARTQKTMDKLNSQMGATTKTTVGLAKTVTAMDATSAELATTVTGMDAETAKMVELLGMMPAATDRTHKQLEQIGGDTADINVELSSISERMARYGLPQAKGVQKR